ncbi:hypothetical protein OROGR_010386 [Orobanche gracilis]
MQQGAAPSPTQGRAAEPADAPPKQVAQALEQLGQAGRLIADVRIGADRLLEALFFVGDKPHHQHSAKCLSLILKEESLMRHHLQNLRAMGRQLEESGVLNESLRARSNSWGLHMPLVCPDGAVVAYAWKRQLAGQAGASAVDRTRTCRLALKAFTDQKRRFFPHLADDSIVGSALKKHCSPQPISHEEFSEQKTLGDILTHLEEDVPNLQTFTYQRLDWLKRASSLSSLAGMAPTELSQNHGFPNTRNWRQVISLHTAGSMDPAAVAFFSSDEGGTGSCLHAWSFSSHHVFRHISEHAFMALQYFASLGLRLPNTVHESVQQVREATVDGQAIRFGIASRKTPVPKLPLWRKFVEELILPELPLRSYSDFSHELLFGGIICTPVEY